MVYSHDGLGAGHDRGTLNTRVSAEELVMSIIAAGSAPILSGVLRIAWNGVVIGATLARKREIAALMIHEELQQA